MDAQTRGRWWSSGEVVLDDSALVLTAAGEVVAVEPIALELLRVPVRRTGEVVTKDALLDAVWPLRLVPKACSASPWRS
jgi:DNA-binding winged helix-turn-helix (wHTH) protein